MEHSDARSESDEDIVICDCDREICICMSSDNTYGALPYICDKVLENGQLCPKAFGKKNRLDRHLLTHSDDKPFVCDKC